MASRVRVQLDFVVEILKTDQTKSAVPRIHDAIEAALPSLFPGIVEANIRPGARCNLSAVKRGRRG